MIGKATIIAKTMIDNAYLTFADVLSYENYKKLMSICAISLEIITLVNLDCNLHVFTCQSKN